MKQLILGCTLFILFSSFTQSEDKKKEKLPNSLQEVQKEQQLTEIDEELFLLERKARRYRLWARHYDREARRIFHMDWGLYRKWIQQSEDNRRQAQETQEKIFAVEERRLELLQSDEIYR